MNKEQLSDAIGQVNDELVTKTAPPHRKRRWWRMAVAAAACLAVAAGAVLIPRAPAAGLPGGVNRLATAVYPPELTEPQRTEDGSYVDEAAGEQWFELCWNNDRQAARLSGTLDAYEKTIVRQLLSDRQGENRVVSPLNLYMTLGMLAECTAGDSRAQILRLTGADSVEQLRRRTGALWLAEYRDSSSGVCRLANSLWLQKGLQYTQNTVNRLAQAHYASVFSGEMGSAAYDRALQDWLNEQTGGLLGEAVRHIETQQQTTVALASTVYFQAKWREPFLKEDTRDGVFHGAGGDVACRYMTKTDTAGRVYLGQGFRAASLGFGSDQCSMWFVLPDEGSSVEELLESGAWLEPSRAQELTSCILSWRVPPLDVSSERELSRDLQALGVSDVFSGERADFSPLLTEDDSFISQMNHAARVTVDEEGCTAAAFTVVDWYGAGPPNETLRIDLHLERPFLFYITGDTGSVLFCGVVEQP